jgi:hypothetical protein
LRSDLNSYEETIPLAYVNFEILPPGEYQLGEIERYYQQFEKTNAGVPVCWDRLKAIYNLGVTKCYVGKARWYGYIVFELDWNSQVVLDCPIYGNAIYVLPKSGWQSLVQLSRKELLETYRPMVTKIRHSGDWLGRLRETLHLSLVSILQSLRVQPPR